MNEAFPNRWVYRSEVDPQSGVVWWYGAWAIGTEMIGYVHNHDGDHTLWCALFRGSSIGTFSTWEAATEAVAVRIEAARIDVQALLRQQAERETHRRPPALVREADQEEKDVAVSAEETAEETARKRRQAVEDAQVRAHREKASPPRIYTVVPTASTDLGIEIWRLDPETYGRSCGRGLMEIYGRLRSRRRRTRYVR